MKSFKKALSLFSLVLVAVSFTVCTSAAESDTVPTDLIVYGKIFTSEGNNIAEAFAVKDGKYVYVGDKKGAEAFIEKGKTEVIDYTGKGLVMSGCGNGHAHYLSAYAVQSFGTMIGFDDDVNKFLTEIVPHYCQESKRNRRKSCLRNGLGV